MGIYDEQFRTRKKLDQEMLENFTFICMLGFDVYIKKMMIEEFIDMSKKKHDNDDDKKKDK